MTTIVNPWLVREVAGRRLKLRRGVRYVASCNIDDVIGRGEDWGNSLVPVLIREISDQIRTDESAELIVKGFTPRQADAFLKEFNNGTTSFDGRVWPTA